MLFVGASAVASAALTWATWTLLAEFKYDKRPSDTNYNELLGVKPLDATASLRTLDAATTDTVIGRNDEIDRLVCILCRRTKNCAALVGAAGVGKTAIAEGLAQRIASGAVPDALVGARVVEVDLAAMVAGTRYRGMFEERMKNVIKRAEASNGKIILFVDEMHMLYSAGSSRTNCTSASNMLKPALARGRIRCVGATTFDEYRQYVEKDPALELRFQKVHVGEPSIEATIAILRGLKQRFQDHHGLEIQDAALVAAARLGARYITGISTIVNNSSALTPFRCAFC